MTQKQNFIKTGAKAKLVFTLPDLADAENGEIFYDLTNDKLAVKTTEGWKQATFS